MKILLLILILAVSCTKKIETIKKPPPINYGDPRNNIIDTVKTSK